MTQLPRLLINKWPNYPGYQTHSRDSSIDSLAALEKPRFKSLPHIERDELDTPMRRAASTMSPSRDVYLGKVHTLTLVLIFRQSLNLLNLTFEFLPSNYDENSRGGLFSLIQKFVSNTICFWSGHTAGHLFLIDSNHMTSSLADSVQRRWYVHWLRPVRWRTEQHPETSPLLRLPSL